VLLCPVSQQSTTNKAMGLCQCSQPYSCRGRSKEVVLGRRLCPLLLLWRQPV
jgi:hypothetical protein